MFENQIAKGVALLDEKVPGWLERIDGDSLNMMCGDYTRGACGCVLAQVDADGRRYGSYWDMARALGVSIKDDSAKALGFDVDGSPNDWRALTAEWKATILRLRSERAEQGKE